jgi:hypothetical protein
MRRNVNSRREINSSRNGSKTRIFIPSEDSRDVNSSGTDRSTREDWNIRERRKQQGGNTSSRDVNNSGDARNSRDTNSRRDHNKSWDPTIPTTALSSPKAESTATAEATGASCPATLALTVATAEMLTAVRTPTTADHKQLCRSGGLKRRLSFNSQT